MGRSCPSIPCLIREAAKWLWLNLVHLKLLVRFHSGIYWYDLNLAAHRAQIELNDFFKKWLVIEEVGRWCIQVFNKFHDRYFSLLSVISMLFIIFVNNNDYSSMPSGFCSINFAIFSKQTSNPVMIARSQIRQCEYSLLEYSFTFLFISHQECRKAFYTIYTDSFVTQYGISTMIERSDLMIC